MKTVFLTSQYYWSHGKNPSGYGLWCFKLPYNGDPSGDNLFFFNGSYAQGKIAAAKKLKEQNKASSVIYNSIEVMP